MIGAPFGSTDISETNLDNDTCLIQQNELGGTPSTCAVTFAGSNLAQKLSAAASQPPILPSFPVVTATAAPRVNLNASGSEYAGAIITATLTPPFTYSQEKNAYEGVVEVDLAGTYSVKLLGQQITSGAKPATLATVKLQAGVPIKGDPATVQATANATIGDLPPFSQTIVSGKSGTLQYSDSIHPELSKNLCPNFSQSFAIVPNILTLNAVITCPLNAGYWYSALATIQQSTFELAPYAIAQIDANATFATPVGLISAAVQNNADILDVYAKAGLIAALVTNPSDPTGSTKQYAVTRPYVFGTANAVSGYTYVVVSAGKYVANILIATYSSKLGFASIDPGAIQVIRFK